MSQDSAKVAVALRGRQYERLLSLTVDDWKLAATLMSSGVAPSAIPAALRDFSPSKEYKVEPAGLGQGKRRILAYSFLRDPVQYSTTYGQTDAWAGNLRGVLEKDPQTAMKEITAVVNAKLAAKGATAMAIVEHGQPRGTSGANATGGASDVNYPALQAAMVKYSAQAGVYEFKARDSGVQGPRRFVVSLGSELWTGAQKKSTAIMAARLVRVLGRNDKAVVPYVGGGAKPDDVDWDIEDDDDYGDGRVKAVRVAIHNRGKSEASAERPLSPTASQVGVAPSSSTAKGKQRESASPEAGDGGEDGKTN